MPSAERSGSRRPSGGGTPPSGGHGGKPGRPASGGGKPRSGGTRSGPKPAASASTGAPRRNGRPDDRGEEGPRQWGALARRGSRRLAEDIRNTGTKAPHQGPPAPREPVDEWIREEVRVEARQAVGRGRRPAATPARGSGQRPKQGRAGEAPPDDRAEAELARAVGTARASRANQRLRDATRAFEREQYAETRRLLRPIVAEAPNAAAIRELLGLAYYRLGQWTQAVRELEAFRDLTGSTEQHPVLADCYRALKRYSAADALWQELRESSPAADLVAEGRIVAAGTLADRGRLAEAVALLEKGRRDVKRPQVHHLRVAYALADLRERSGDVPGARELFLWVARNEPDFADAVQRAGALR